MCYISYTYICQIKNHIYITYINMIFFMYHVIIQIFKHISYTHIICIHSSNKQNTKYGFRFGQPIHFILLFSCFSHIHCFGLLKDKLNIYCECATDICSLGQGRYSAVPDYSARYKVIRQEKAGYPAKYDKACRIIKPDIRHPAEKTNPAQP